MTSENGQISVAMLPDGWDQLAEMADLLQRQVARVPYEMVRGCLASGDGYRGPDVDELGDLLTPGQMLDSLQRLAVFSAIALHRLGELEERSPLSVLDDLWPAGGR